MEKLLSEKARQNLKQRVFTEKYLFKMGNEFHMKLGEIERIRTNENKIEKSWDDLLNLYVQRKKPQTTEELMIDLGRAFYFSELGTSFYDFCVDFGFTNSFPVLRTLDNKPMWWRLERLILQIAETMLPENVQKIVIDFETVEHSFEKCLLAQTYQDPWKKNICMLQLLWHSFGESPGQFLRKLIENETENMQIKKLCTTSGLADIYENLKEDIIEKVNV